MILLTPSTPWAQVHARLTAGDQILRLLNSLDPEAGGMLMDQDRDRLQLTAGYAGVRNPRRKVRDPGTLNQHIEVHGRALENLRRTASQFSIEYAT